MASRKDDSGVAVLDRPEPQAETAPVFVAPVGRGGRGKSEWARWAWERGFRMGRPVLAADGDRTNPTLTAFVPAASRPESPAAEDVKAWLGSLLERQIAERASLVLDLGGGDLVLKEFAREVGLVEFLGSYGVEPVAVHLIGPDLDDLAYLRDMEDGIFAPRRTVLVLNEGIIPTGRATANAFRPVVEHKIFQDALDRGAKAVVMPRLPCMADLDRLRLHFEDAEAGAEKDGVYRVGPVDRFRVKTWRKAMEEAFAPVASWLP